MCIGLIRRGLDDAPYADAVVERSVALCGLRGVVDIEVPRHYDRGFSSGVEVLDGDAQACGEAGDGLLLDGVEVEGLTQMLCIKVRLNPVAGEVGITEEGDSIGIVDAYLFVTFLGDLHIDEAIACDTGLGDALEVRAVGEGVEGFFVRGAALLGDIDRLIAAGEDSEGDESEGDDCLAIHHCAGEERVGELFRFCAAGS